MQWRSGLVTIGLMPDLYVIAGPNGVGKTTFAKEFLPSYAKCTKFINADLIAQGLAPFAPGTMLIKSGKLLLEQIRELAKANETFAFETTLAGKTYISFLKQAKRQGYQVHVFFLWIPTVELALGRIANRVRMGGHEIPAETVRRRFRRSTYNFFHYYQQLADSWYLFNSSGIPPVLVARQEHGELAVLDPNLYTHMSQHQGSSHA